jgi:hypothetical protein
MATVDVGLINTMAKNTATANGIIGVSSAQTLPIVDSEGNPALEITLVLSSELSTNNLPRHAASTTLVQMHDWLLQMGDERFPYLRYATPEDLKATLGSDE